ncbi:hypothetical protein [Priestia megaterium]|uniref:hypothetical protein n=1 Tax=Priestia megaterium TaxID=1404 RepID=UPI000BFB4091|nr:hypothetical protein [Priestia megaterium]PGR10584.1 hypothetical protein COA23_03120 [Priestia megaterium]
MEAFRKNKKRPVLGKQVTRKGENYEKNMLIGFTHTILPPNSEKTVKRNIKQKKRPALGKQVFTKE